MGKTAYVELLRDPRWQRKRLEIMSRDGFRCRGCGTENGTLHVHHEYYVSGRKPWQYEEFVYRTLCSDCHQRVKDDAADEMCFGLFEAILSICGGIENAHHLACEMNRLSCRLGIKHQQAYEMLLKMIKDAINESNLHQTIQFDNGKHDLV